MTASRRPGAALLIDAGSTNLKWAWLVDGRLEPGFARAHGNAPAVLIAEIPVVPVSCVLVASVLRQADSDDLVEPIRQRFGMAPEFAKSEPSRCGVVNGYADAGELGIDRWLGMLAAWSRRSEGQVVVDCGTAVTIDVLDDAGRHLGGQIVPGVAAMRRCLAQSTRLSPDDERPTAVLGRGTAQCVAAGIHLALAAAIERAGDELTVYKSNGPRVIMTGGDATLIAPLVRRPLEVRPHLVLEGLVTWAGLDRKE